MKELDEMTLVRVIFVVLLFPFNKDAKNFPFPPKADPPSVEIKGD
ncbi:hypothetical protein ACFL40_01120 [candidate division KSB1 bacterium]